jgi:hypothetical protein
MKGSKMPVDINHYSYSIETEYKSVGERSVLEWTTEPPKAEGYFWARQEVSGEIFIVNVIKLASDYLTTDAGPLHNFTHWLGPLPVPQPPSEGE